MLDLEGVRNHSWELFMVKSPQSSQLKKKKSNTLHILGLLHGSVVVLLVTPYSFLNPKSEHISGQHWDKVFDKEFI